MNIASSKKFDGRLTDHRTFFICWSCLDQLKTDEVAANEQSLIGFDGAESVLKVYLNGDFIGHSKGAR